MEPSPINLKNTNRIFTFFFKFYVIIIMGCVNSGKNTQKNPGFWYTKMQPTSLIQTQNPVQDVLRDFLHVNRATGPEWNIAGFGGRQRDIDYDCLVDAGKFNVLDTDYVEKFLKSVHDTIFESGCVCSLLEKHHPHGGPILIDLDFRYENTDVLQRRFTDTMIRKFVEGYIGALYRFFHMSKSKPLRFFVLKKDGPVAEKGKHQDGIHIHCPDLTLTPEEQYILRGYALQQNLIQNIFDETGFTNVEHDVFDGSIIHRNNWFLYGASKPNKSPYKVHNIYRVSGDNEIIEENINKYTTLELTQLLSIRHGHQILSSLIVLEERKSEWKALGNLWGNGKSTPNRNMFD